jgi:signal transduction histidine kinase
MMVIPLKYEVIGEERKKNETVTKGVVRFISAHSHPSFWPIDFKRAYAIANTLSVIFYQEKILDELKTKQESIENLSAKRGELLNFMFQASERTNINEIILDLISLISEWDGVQDIDIIDMANSDQEIDRCLFLDADQKNRLKSFINQERTLDGIFDGDIQAWPVKSKNSLFAIILTQISYNDIKLHEWFQFACLCLASYYSIYKLINERKRLTKEIEENEMETIAGMFARKVGHEVLNAVKSIHSWAKLNQKTSPDFSGLANRVNILSENVDLLIRSSGYNIIRKECVFVKEVEKILKKLRLKNDSMFNDCLIKLSVAGHKHRKIHLDPATLIGIIHNLVLNSYEQYALNQKKGGPIEISIVEKEIDNILNIGLSVKDYALGIPEENLDKIFEENFTTKPSGGKGIGLTIVENLASICGGKIKVETEYGHFADIRVFYRVID